MPNQEIYVSTDVETDGPIPGPHSMLSFASAAYSARKELLGTFSANLETLPARLGIMPRLCRAGAGSEPSGYLDGAIKSLQSAR